MMDTMLAARYMGPHRIEAETVAVPELRPGDALIQIDACGFCGSDINIVAGSHPRASPPLTIGHEVSGHIVRLTDSSTPLAVGDRVTPFPLISCGKCWACTHGQSHVCQNLGLFGFDADGGMAEFMRLPLDSLLKLPPRISARAGALIEPLAVAVHGVRRASIEGMEIAAVLGAGPIGLLTALVARARGVPQVLISDVLPARLALAARLGLNAMPAGEELQTRLNQLSGGRGADIVYECAGHPSSAAEMTRLVRSRGSIVNLGVFKRPVEIDMQAVNFKEAEIFGSRVYERADFEKAINLAPQLPLESLITHEFALRDVTTAFRTLMQADACKVLILPSISS